MKEGVFQEKKYKYIFMVLALGAVLVNVKSILTDYNYDAGYAVAVAYRMIHGDDMFVQMWEPHQTSAFLCAGLMKLYLGITGTTTGIVLYLQVMGVVLKMVMTVFLYQSMKKLVRRDVLLLMCLFFFTVTPKGLPMPEFANMQVWFAVGLFCCLVRYLQTQKQKGWLVAAALFLCLEILAYPSCLLVYGGVLVLLFLYSGQRWKDCLVFSGVCLACGSAYLGWFILRLGFTGFLENIGHVISGDATHDSGFVDKWLAYLQECGEMLLWLAGLAVIALCLTKGIAVMCRFISKGKISLSVKRVWIIGYFLLFLMCDVIQALRVEMTYEERLPIYIPILFLAVCGLYKCEEQERQIVVSGLWISLLSFVATLLLTNLNVSATLNYLILAVMVAFLPITRGIEAAWEQRKRWIPYGVVLLFLAATVFRTGYIMKCMSTQKTNIRRIEGKVQDGPAKGLLSEYMGAYMLNTALTEWSTLVKPGDKVLIVGAGIYDPLLYLFENVEICVPSTICTSTYDEKLLTYWEKYPEKYPDVVIVDCWYGQLRVEQDSFIMQWMEEEFEPVSITDGSYWRYYRTK